MGKILIVDDSDVFRTQLRKTLEEGGHNVLDAASGFQCLEVLEKDKDIQLIFCDVNMPGMDGLSLCQKIRENHNKTIPILMLTTEASQDMKQKAKEIGITGWIVKPYNGPKLLEVAKKLTSGSP